MMVKSVSLIIIVIFIMLASLHLHGKEENDPPLYTQYAAEVTSIFIKEMYKDYGLECGWSGGRMPYDIEEISVGLFTYRSVTIEQARELEVKATERFAQIINAHSNIKPFLREYPFPASRAHISISFRKKDSYASISNDDIEFVSHAKNRLYYQVHDPKNPYVGKDFKDEPYEEALKIVQRSATLKK